MSIEKVIQGGFCVGCGACAAVAPESYAMRFDPYGRLVARDIDPSASSVIALADRVCPFSDASDDEDTVAEALFPDAPHRSPMIGRYRRAYVGHVEEGEFRQRGSSGGLGTWILSELLRRGQVDAVVHVRPCSDSPDGRLFGFAISRTADEVLRGAKSRYYPVEMSAVLDSIRREKGRIALVGVPCFVKAARLVARQDAQIDARLAYCIGLVCGHLKSTGFGRMLAWQLGFGPDTPPSEVDFRVKLEGRPASRYGFAASASSRAGKARKVSPMDELYGGDWGQSLFKYKSCDYCDDVLAELADVVVGDAWLPEFEADWRGTNVVVTRSAQIDALIADAISAGRLRLTETGESVVVKTQDAGLRHRRAGLAYRLSLDDAAGRWRPRKRVQANRSALPFRAAMIQRLRIVLRDRSHRALAEATARKDFGHFLSEMKFPVFVYKMLYRRNVLASALQKLRRALVG